jgi:hypothetical protein
MKKLYSMEIRGNTKQWSFYFHGDPKYVNEWRDDGLEINEIINVIPEWIVSIGLMRPWVFFQAHFNFRFKDLFK